MFFFFFWLFQAVEESFDFGVRHNKAERLAGKHGSNVGGFGHNKKRVFRAVMHFTSYTLT